MLRPFLFIIIIILDNTMGKFRRWIHNSFFSISNDKPNVAFAWFFFFLISENLSSFAYSLIAFLKKKGWEKYHSHFRTSSWFLACFQAHLDRVLWFKKKKKLNNAQISLYWYQYLIRWELITTNGLNYWSNLLFFNYIAKMSFRR